jgi:hypothetical protein
MHPAPQVLRATGMVSLLLIAMAAPLFAQSGPSALDRSEWALIRPMPLVTVEIRKVVGMVLFIPAFTLLLLYLFRPRPYVFAGVATWVAAATMLLALSVDSGTRLDDTPGQIVAGKLGIVTWAVCAMLFGASVRFSGLWFRAPAAFPRSIRWWVLAIAAWVVVASTALRAWRTTTGCSPRS